MKTQAKTMRRFAALLLTMLMLLCVCALPAVSAAGGDPVDPVWNGKTATWKPPAKSTSKYMLALYRDGQFLADYETTETTYDFTDTLKNAGPGSYVFSVMAVFDDTSTSAIIDSNTYQYQGEPHPHALKHVDGKKPTCTENGVVEHFECPVCGKYYWDSMAQNVIDDQSEVVLPATGHSWGEWTTTKAATTTEEGEQKRVCQNDASHVETKTIPKVTVPTTVAPTTVPKTTAPATTAATKPSTAPTSQPTTKPSAAPTSQPTTGRVSAVTDSTVPSTVFSGAVVDASRYDGGAGTILGLPAPFFFALLIGAVLLFGVLPAVLIPVLVISAKKRRAQSAPPPRMNGSEYLPPRQFPPREFPPKR